MIIIRHKRLGFLLTQQQRFLNFTVHDVQRVKIDGEHQWQLRLKAKDYGDKTTAVS